MIPWDQSSGIKPEEKTRLKSMVKAVNILFLENLRNSFRIKSEEQALLSLSLFKHFKTSSSVISEFNSKLCSLIFERSISGLGASLLLTLLFSFSKCSAKVSSETFCKVSCLDWSTLFNEFQYDLGSEFCRARSL